MYILPVLSALTTFVQSKQTMPDTSSAQNKMMLYFMPLFIGYISFSFPAGLVLYWVVMNLMQIGQQALMNKATVKIIATGGEKYGFPRKKQEKMLMKL